MNDNNTCLKIAGVSPTTLIDCLHPGQVFYEKDKKITAQTCWIAECFCDPLDLDGDGGFMNDGRFMLPVMPTASERAFFLQKKLDCWVDAEYLMRQNESLSVYRTKLSEFLKNLPEIPHGTNLKDELDLIRKAVTHGSLSPNRDSVGDPFQRHLYIAATHKGRFLYMEFDDNCYRPEVRPAPCHADGAVYYNDFLDTARGWAELPEATTQKMFRRVSDVAIDALNQGLDGFVKIPQKALPAGARQVYHLFDHIHEIHLAPTFWVVDNNIIGTYDILANWQACPDGSVCASLGEFMIYHEPGMAQMGKIVRNMQRTIAKAE